LRAAPPFAWLVWLVLAFWPGASSRAEQLPFRHYGAAEGLAGSSVHAIYQDRSGYLLVGGAEGLSRFDGYRFVTHGVRDGLGHPFVGAMAEDREGRLWVGTNGGGVARLIEEGAASPPKQAEAGASPIKFVNSRIGESVATNRVNKMAFDAQDALWCLTDGGLYRRDPTSLRFEAVVPRGPFTAAMPLLVDSRGRVWAGIYKELVLVERGQVTSWAPPEPVAEHHLRAIVEDPRGRILAANHFGLFEYRPPTPGSQRGSWGRLPLTLAPRQEVRSMWAARDGVLWIGTTHGLVKYVGGRQALYTTANGLKSDFIWTLFGDRDGNLWIGTSAGLVRLAGEAAVSWTMADGLPDGLVSRVYEARDGRVYVRTARGGFAEIVGGKAVLVRGSQDLRFDGVVNAGATQVLQDRRGDWWVVTRPAVHRFRGPRLQFRRGRRFGPGDGLREGTPFSGSTDGIHEDPAGRIWIGSKTGLFRFDPSKRRAPAFDFLPFVDFVQPDEVNDVVGLRSGTLWFMTHAQLGRVVDGRIEWLWPTEARPRKRPRALFVDSRDRVWFGLLYGGLWMTAEPDAKEPSWTHYSTADGLSSDSVNAIGEDHLGRIYVGTSRGLDRLELDTGRIRTFTSQDGLAGDFVNHVLRDRRGYLWVSTMTGLTRFDPRSEPAPGPAPPVLFTHLQVAGEEVRLPERGAREIPALRLGASNNNLLIEYVGLSFRNEGSLRYQYRLDGIDADWSPPGEQRSVNYARLAPGAYRFLVRAVTPEGQAGREPATLAFQIAGPFWHSRWFLISAALALAVVVESLHRLRLRRRLELEAVRTRIATDLHDDVGSNLSRIAILSEVARRDLDGGNPAASGSATSRPSRAISSTR
jgi:ligand-binding sensor domain-containing protein